MYVGSASRAQVLQYELVQKSIYQFYDHNHEEQDGAFTRPTLDLYVVNNYWKFLTKDLSAEEIADLEVAKKNLENYERIYTIFEYGWRLAGLMTTLETRIANNNPTIPLTIYRKVIIIP